VVARARGSKAAVNMELLQQGIVHRWNVYEDLKH
jgi:hypothetical protein